jgi:hypothetical protein
MSDAKLLSRAPLLVAGTVLLIFAAILGYNAVDFMATAIRQYPDRDGWGFAPYMNAFASFYAFVGSAFILGLAFVTIRAPRPWAIASAATGGLIALGLGSWLSGNHHDGHARVMLIIGGIIVACALVAFAVETALRVRSILARSAVS